MDIYSVWPSRRSTTSVLSIRAGQSSSNYNNNPKNNTNNPYYSSDPYGTTGTTVSGHGGFFDDPNQPNLSSQPERYGSTYSNRSNTSYSKNSNRDHNYTSGGGSGGNGGNGGNNSNSNNYKSGSGLVMPSPTAGSQHRRVSESSIRSGFSMDLP